VRALLSRGTGEEGPNNNNNNNKKEKKKKEKKKGAEEEVASPAAKAFPSLHTLFLLLLSLSLSLSLSFLVPGVRRTFDLRSRGQKGGPPTPTRQPQKTASGKPAGWNRSISLLRLSAVSSI